MADQNWPVGKPSGAINPVTLIYDAYHPPRDPDVSFAGKTVLVTGANSGVGLEAAIKFAAKGAARLILGVRSKAKGEDTKATIVSRVPGFAPSAILIYELEHESFASVKAFATAISTDIDRIDVLLLNAGIIAGSYGVTSDGWERTLQVNCLSPILLALLLLPKLRETGRTTGEASRLVITGSQAYMIVRDVSVPSDVPAETSFLDHFNFNKKIWDAREQYNVSKLAIMFCVQSIAAQLVDPDDPTLLVCCPAGCRTNVFKEFPVFLRVPVKFVFYFLGRSPEQGSRTLVSAATLGMEAQGGFWKNDVLDEKIPLMGWARYEELKKDTWNSVRKVLLSVDPQVGKVLG